MVNNRRSFLGVGFGATLMGYASQSDARAGVFHRRKIQCVPSSPPCVPAPTPIEPNPAPTVYQLPDGSYAFAPSHDFKIGTAHWITFKTDKIPRPPFYKYYKCDNGADVIATVSHPNIDAITPQINDCLTTAAVAAAVAVIIAAINGAAGGTGGVAVSTFQGALVACLAAKGVADASAITVHLSTANSTQDCHPI